MKSVFQSLKQNFIIWVISFVTLTFVVVNFNARGQRLLHQQLVKKEFSRVIYKNEPFKVENLSIKRNYQSIQYQCYKI